MNKNFKYDRKDMLNPILDILKKENRSLSVRELDDRLITEMGISEEQSNIPHNDKSNRKRTELNYRSAWAKTYLKKIGYISNKVIGYWEITEVGKEIDTIDFDQLEMVMQKGGKKNFLLKRVVISDKYGEIINVNFTNQDSNDSDFHTLIIGKNTSGKSFLVGQITEVFVYLEKYKRFIRANNLKYQHYLVEYNHGNKDYVVMLDFSLDKEISPITVLCNSEKIPFEKLILPSKVIAVSYNLNDRFNTFSKETDMYYYQGINRFKSKEFVNSIWDCIANMLNNNKVKELEKILQTLGYNFPINMYFTYKEEKKSNNFRTQFKKKDEPDFVSIDTNQSDVGYRVLIKRIEKYISMSKEIRMQISINDADNTEKKDIDDLSSGEKQLLFTFLNLCAEIQKSSLIIIDEPENSLHPTWQTKYLFFLKELFENMDLKSHLIFATHSPFLVANLDKNSSSIVVSELEESKRFYNLLSYSPYAWSIENILYQVFEVETTRNIYIDRDMQTIINHFSGITNLKVDDRALIDSFVRLLRIDNLTETDPLREFLEDAKIMLKEREPQISKKIESGQYDEL